MLLAGAGHPIRVRTIRFAPAYNRIMTEPALALVTRHPKAHPVMAAVIAVGGYEIVADVINDLLGADLLPSFRGAIDRFSWAALGRRAVPRWTPQATVITAGIVLGAVAPIPWRSPEAEAVLKGQTLNEATATKAAEAALAAATPMTQNAYKVQVAKTAVKRALLHAAGVTA